MPSRLAVGLVVLAVPSCAGGGGRVGVAPQRKAPARLTPLAEHPSAQPGSIIRLALAVSLPEGLHMQSDAPRDASLIPTTLMLDPPAGITIEEVVFPPATDFVLEGFDAPLSVFEVAAHCFA